MKLEESPLGDDAGMAHVQSQLVALRIQLSEIMKEKENSEDIWCITCKIKGHRKEECPTFAYYMETGEPNPSVGRVGYCKICRTRGNHPTSFPLLNKYQIMPRNLFCNF
jgi:hypothetical protein